MKKIVISAFFLGLCILSLGLTACDSSPTANGDNQTKAACIKLTIYDKNDEVIDTVSSVTANDNAKLSFNVNRRHIFEVVLVQRGGSDNDNVLSNAIVRNYIKSLELA